MDRRSKHFPFRYAAVAITECVRQELLFLNETVKITAISPGLIESDIIQANANDDIVRIMPALKPADVAAAVLYAISVKENVQVRKQILSYKSIFISSISRFMRLSLSQWANSCEIDINGYLRQSRSILTNLKCLFMLNYQSLI